MGSAGPFAHRHSRAEARRRDPARMDRRNSRMPHDDQLGRRHSRSFHQARTRRGVRGASAHGPRPWRLRGPLRGRSGDDETGSTIGLRARTGMVAPCRGTSRVVVSMGSTRRHTAPRVDRPARRDRGRARTFGAGRTREPRTRRMVARQKEVATGSRHCLHHRGRVRLGTGPSGTDPGASADRAGANGNRPDCGASGAKMAPPASCGGGGTTLGVDEDHGVESPGSHRVAGERHTLRVRRGRGRPAGDRANHHEGGCTVDLRQPRRGPPATESSAATQW